MKRKRRRQSSTALRLRAASGIGRRGLFLAAARELHRFESLYFVDLDGLRRLVDASLNFDAVAEIVQDVRRGWLYGTRTDGAGGNNTTFDAGSYSEGLTGMTLALQTRQYKVSNAFSGYPYTEYIENVGVWPDVPIEYMTKDNLLQNGVPFLTSVLQHLAYEIRKIR